MLILDMGMLWLLNILLRHYPFLLSRGLVWKKMKCCFSYMGIWLIHLNYNRVIWYLLDLSRRVAPANSSPAIR